MFAARTDHGHASGFQYAETDEVAWVLESSTLHPVDVAGEAVQSLFDLLTVGLSEAFPARLFDQVFNLVLQQSLGPAAKLDLVVWMFQAAQQRGQGSSSMFIHDGRIGSLALAWFGSPFLPLWRGDIYPFRI